jgi:hypothetical protein
MRAGDDAPAVVEEAAFFPELLRDALEVGTAGKPVLRMYGVGVLADFLAQAPDRRAIRSRDDLQAYVGMVKVRLRPLAGDMREDDQPLESLDALDTGQFGTAIPVRPDRLHSEDQRSGSEVPGPDAQHHRQTVVLGTVRKVAACAGEADRGVGPASRVPDLTGQYT